MPWEDEQEQLTREARLFHSSPEVVFEEIKKLGQAARSDRFLLNAGKAEPTLLERNDRLINLGLACYGVNKEVFKALYEYSLEPADNAADALYKRGLRIGCLSNQTIAEQNWIFDFPQDTIGPEETERIVLQGDGDEQTALMGNPTISDRLLVALYERTHGFATMPDQQWYRLIMLSSVNERLNTNKDSDGGPDLGHGDIHRAIFRSLQVAPVSLASVRVLYTLLDRLDPQHVASPERIDDVLARWNELDGRDHKGEPEEGLFTTLSLKDEFRCLIAAVYGRGYVNNKFVVHGSPTASDIAARCAFYGKGDLTVKEMKAGFERDKDAYAFAALFNSDVYARRDQRVLFEDQHLNGSLAPKYRQRLNQIRKRWPRIVEGPLSQWLEEEASKGSVGTELEGVKTALAKIEDRLGRLASQLRNFEHAVFWGGLTVAFLLWIFLKR
jgi:hypothetical protein